MQQVLRYDADMDTVTEQTNSGRRDQAALADQVSASLSSVYDEVG